MKTNSNANEESGHSPDAVLRQRIEERAYRIWLESGCGHGDHDRHWLQAERELMEPMPNEGGPQSDPRAGKKNAKRR